MLIDIDGYYDIPDDWSGVLLKEFVSICDLASKAPTEEATEKERIDFYVEFISLFGIPKEDLKKVKIVSEEEGELGIINLFNHLWQFTQMPAENVFKFESFTINKTTYLFNEDSISLTGGNKPMASYTLEEYEEANSILTSMTGVGEGKMDNLSLLCAVFFRPAVPNWWNFLTTPIIEPYNANKVLERSELFMEELTMDKVFSAYFFLLNRMIGLENSTVTSLLKELEESLS